MLNDLRETVEGGDDELEDGIWDKILDLLYYGFYSSRMLYCRTYPCSYESQYYLVVLLFLIHAPAATVHVSILYFLHN